MTSDEARELLSAIGNGDVSAFERFYDATAPRIYGIVVRILRRPDLAAQAMQEVYVRIWQNAAAFDPATATPMSWIVASARARALDLVRSPEFQPGSLPPEAMGEDSAAAPRQITDELRTLLGCLSDLEPQQRRLLLLAYYSGWTREQLAARFETGLENVRTWLRAALLRVRECLP
jgi:RNA polymerase sigma-70 factor (ECF subfamily)